MEDTSRLRERLRLPLVIPVLPYLRDHHFEGKIILPAVEILQRLAGSVRSYRSDAYVSCMHRASFDRFLHIDVSAETIEVFHELEIYESGRMVSQLVTIGKVRNSPMTRTKMHAAVNFIPAGESVAGLPDGTAPADDGICYRVPSRKLYHDLVPFGPSFQNVRDDLLLSARSAVARVYAADHPSPSEPLGSPFPFDGAMHAACAWGQRYHHVVAFPVGFKKRLVVRPTAAGETYHCTVLPVPGNGESLKFDIWIHDPTGSLYEEIRGVIMRDVFGGRIRPPDWIMHERTDGSNH